MPTSVSPGRTIMAKEGGVQEVSNDGSNCCWWRKYHIDNIIELQTNKSNNDFKCVGTNWRKETII